MVQQGNVVTLQIEMLQQPGTFQHIVVPVCNKQGMSMQLAQSNIVASM